MATANPLWGAPRIHVELQKPGISVSQADMNTRTHLSPGKEAPASRPVTPLPAGRIVEIPQVNGLHHRYDRASA